MRVASTLMFYLDKAISTSMKKDLIQLKKNVAGAY